ncbi:MAG: RidA family protein [Devosia sp.]|nr:RidA family protein [Devosia sp.]
MKIDLKSVPLSPARRAGDLLFLSGQIVFHKDGQVVGNDVASQTHQVFRNIETVPPGQLLVHELGERPRMLSTERQR